MEKKITADTRLLGVKAHAKHLMQEADAETNERQKMIKEREDALK